MLVLEDVTAELRAELLQVVLFQASLAVGTVTGSVEALTSSGRMNC